jgi:RNA polymerase sigma-70 factor (ECF subfamily)
LNAQALRFHRLRSECRIALARKNVNESFHDSSGTRHGTRTRTAFRPIASQAMVSTISTSRAGQRFRAAIHALRCAHDEFPDSNAGPQSKCHPKCASQIDFPRGYFASVWRDCVNAATGGRTNGVFILNRRIFSISFATMKRPSALDSAIVREDTGVENELGWFGAARRGDLSAFEQLFRSYAADLVTFAESYVDGEEEAEDVVHVVFCWLWEHRFTLPRPTSPRSYLFSAVRNRALNVVRDRRTEAAFRKRIEHESLAGHETATSPSPDNELAAREIAHALADALRRMPPRCREVYTLVRHHGFSYSEVSDALEIAPKTVEIHMSRALVILRRELAPWLTV